MDSKNYPEKDEKIGIVGIPLGFGAGKYGSELGISAIRMAEIRGKHLTGLIEDLGYQVKDYGDTEVVNPNYVAGKNDHPKYLKELAASSKNSYEKLREILSDGRMPVILGGDHSTAIGTFSGTSSYFRDQSQEIGLLWFDAHADINTDKTSESGNIHGMPLAALLGKGNSSLVDLGGFSPKLNSKYFAHVGARDVDPGEKQMINEFGIRRNFYTMSDVDRYGMVHCVEKALEIVSQAPAGFAVTFDVDVIDPRFAPGSGTLVRGGITYREAHLALEMIAERGGMRSFEIVEVNPTLDSANITVELAVELILSALGKTII